MSDVAKYTHLVGRAGRDIERRPESAKPLAKFSLAVEVGYDKEKREALTEWVDVAVWDDLANAMFGLSVDDKGREIEIPLVRKGMRIWVAGRTSVYAGASGDRKQISAREVGTVDRFLVGKAGAAPSLIADETEDALEGITEDEGEW
jgi:single-stranded DNA-binding protein